MEQQLKNELTAPPPELDVADIRDDNASCATTIGSLNFKEHNINTTICTTGFNPDFNYLKLPVFDNDGNPKHKNGVLDFKGLFYLGFSWLRMRKSGMIFGERKLK